MEEEHDNKLIRDLGVSNFMQHHLDKLLPNVAIKPTVNQFEMHPQLQQKQVLE